MDLQGKFWRRIDSRSGGAAVREIDEAQHQRIKRKVCLLVDSLKECSRERDLERGRAIHADARNSGLESNIFLASSLLYMYSKCGSMVDAHRAFDDMVAHDVVTWTSLILGYAENGNGYSALEIFSRMLLERCPPNPRTFVAGLKACSSLAEQEQGLEMVVDMEKKKTTEQQKQEVEKKKMVKAKALEKGMALHSRAMAEKCDLNIFVSNTLVDMYANCGSMEDARAAFERMPCRSVVSWSALVLGYVNNGEPSVALEVFCRMQREGFAPNSQTFVAALKACTCLALGEDWTQVGDEFLKVESLEKGMAVHSQAWKSDLPSSNNFVMNTLVDMYASSGSLWDAHRVFQAMPCHTVVSWNAMILGYAENGNGHLALQLFTGGLC
ncbi:pentatricopeptide repeat-containing protein At2g33680-like [Selaginella moellendorffii]|uniref:pentatricopeptide repeat-containing protein At2g33680-like n=1 Tax=Selaginella moellendorffii TaxID=88036 RepID=UPI000D1C8358|nr:pentatricopeptide repeat-containing protein At2g33680-like [Selaginella moellendorffii]|eukprot:XP_024535522.1 pentatricopeptide repeat-containing protein At2g33680-like [Selaginella moellendorffii]